MGRRCMPRCSLIVRRVNGRSVLKRQARAASDAEMISPSYCAKDRMMFRCRCPVGVAVENCQATARPVCRLRRGPSRGLSAVDTARARSRLHVAAQHPFGDEPIDE